MENTTTYVSGRKSKRSLQSISLPTEIILNIILAVFSFACIFPFIFIVIISFTSQASINKIGYSLIPLEWSTQAYDYVFKAGQQLWQSYFNSILVTVVGTTATMLLTVLYAYALYRRDFKYRSFFTMFAFFTTLFGGGMAPTYAVCNQLLGLQNTYAALIIPCLVSPFYIIVMRTFFQSTIPEELIEAAAIDGAGEYYTLAKIILPITKPGLATVGLLTALGYWNDWELAMFYIRKSELYPLQYLLMSMQQEADFLAKNSAKIGTAAIQAKANYPGLSLRFALVVFIVLPISCAYPFFQKYIISGLTIGSVKG